MIVNSAQLAEAQSIEKPKAAFYKKRLLQPKCALMTVLGRFYCFRRLYKLYKTNKKKISKGNALSLYDDHSTGVEASCLEQIVGELNKSGLFVGISLSAQDLLALKRFTSAATFFGDKDYRYGFLISQKSEAEERHGRPFHLAECSQVQLRQCPVVARISQEPIFTEIAAQYFGVQPVCLGSRLFWTFANESEAYDNREANCYFHYDLDDYGCLRFFFYLTDVDQLSGPHICVRGSHRKKNLAHILTRSHAGHTDEAIESYYGAQDIISVNGKAGLGFIEDAMCFHKATRPLAKDRLILQVTFTINNYNFYQ